MNIRFDGKRALVTGAGRGIGRAVAQALSELGAEVVALSKTQANLSSLKQEVPLIKTVCIDLKDWDATRRVVGEIGPVDLLVNNAGLLIVQKFMETTKEQVDDVMAVNVKALINVSQVIAGDMLKRESGGAIVNVASVASHTYMTDIGIYGSTKSAVDMLTRTMARELGPYHIRVNSVNPGLVMTDMAYQMQEVNREAFRESTPRKTLATVKECVDMILFLLSDRASGINGSTHLVEAGFFA